MNPDGLVGSSSRRRFFIVGTFALIVIGVALVLMWPSAPPAEVPPLLERSRNDLILREGQLFDGEIPFTGLVLEHYGGGELKSRSVVSNGFLEGLSEGWHTNGVIQVRENFVRGISHGVRTKFHSNGNKLSAGQIVNGEIEGLFERWHESGTLAEQINLTNGVAHGESSAFHPDGSLKARVRLDHGTVIQQQFWPSVEANTPDQR